MTSTPKLPLIEATFGNALAELEHLSLECACPLYFMPLADSPSPAPGPNARLIAEWSRRDPKDAPPADTWIEVFGYTTDQELGYWATFHEFGHAVLGHFETKAASARYVNNLVQHEAEAWCWALDNSPYEFGTKPEEYMNEHWFASYLKSNDWTISPEIERISTYVDMI